MNPSLFADVDATVAEYLRDLAYARVGPPQMHGYKRAAAAIMSLDTPLTGLARPARCRGFQRGARVAACHPGNTRYW
jgi:hypothetical protein